MALRNILNWSDPSLSGLIFGSGFVFLLSLSHFSLLSVIAYFSLTLLFFCMGCKVYVHLMGTLKKPCKDPLAKVEVMDLAISAENIEACLAPVVEGLNTATSQLRGLCLVHNILTQPSLLPSCMSPPSSDPSSTPSPSSPSPGSSCLFFQLSMNRTKLKLMKYLAK
eukprot:TRINITY_DN5859_c0_g1_i9.p1 TRINITY_DN5859_c0_g1~~TRINITY_DN5859_c0_g1_i9.p1  ORF type:complete len:166 (-),score=49.71 TRINITY_DN5859_c0_g1_i9:238-735(-)